MSPSAPALPPEEGIDLLRRAAAEEETLSGLTLEGLVLTGEDLSGLELRDVTLQRCRFPGCGWTGVSFTDVVFHTCDLSGGCFDAAFFLRAALTDCRASAIRLQRCRMRQAKLEDCRLFEADFTGCKLQNTAFSRCKLEHARFPQSQFSQVSFAHCDLIGANFVHTLLKDVDLTTCVIDALTLSESCAELRGAVVDLWQAAGLARRLGLIIKEPEEIPHG